MPLTTGSRLGSYEILGLLGAGGMAKSTRPATLASIASSPSRSSLRTSLLILIHGSASSAKRAPSPR